MTVTASYRRSRRIIQRRYARLVRTTIVAPEALQERIRSALAGAVSEVEFVSLPATDEHTVHSSLGRAKADTVEGSVVIVVTDREINARRALTAGADGVVWESKIEQALSPTLEAVRAGQLVIPEEGRGRPQGPALSTREKQVLGLIVLGLANGEIATKLHLTESTVKSHLAAAFKKLGVRSRKDAVDRILDPTDGLGTGILGIADAERISTRSQTDQSDPGRVG